MEAIDKKIQLELVNLPIGLKKKVLTFISQLKSQSKTSKIYKPVSRYGICKDMFGPIPDDLDKISVSEDFKDYI